MRVRLTRKLAECVDGVDLTGCAVGDILEIPERDAACLIAEGWAVPDRVGARDIVQSAGPGHAPSDGAKSPGAAALIPSPTYIFDGHSFQRLLLDAEHLAGAALDHERRLTSLVTQLENETGAVLTSALGVGAAVDVSGLSEVAVTSPAAAFSTSTDLLTRVRELCVEARQHRQLAETILMRLVEDLARPFPPRAGARRTD